VFHKDTNIIGDASGVLHFLESKVDALVEMSESQSTSAVSAGVRFKALFFKLFAQILQQTA